MAVDPVNIPLAWPCALWGPRQFCDSEMLRVTNREDETGSSSRLSCSGAPRLPVGGHFGGANCRDSTGTRQEFDLPGAVES